MKHKATLNMMTKWPDKRFDDMRHVIRAYLTSAQYSHLINARADRKQQGLTNTCFATLTLNTYEALGIDHMVITSEAAVVDFESR